MSIDSIIKSRKSVKKFSKKKPDWRKIIEGIDLTRYTPMAGNLFSLKFILVDNLEKIKQIAKASEQDFIQDAQYIVVVCSNPSLLENSYEEMGKIYLKQQTGSAIQNFLLKLEELGLSTCWIGHFNENEIKKILKIPEKINVEAFFPIGYESNIGKSKEKRKIDLDSILYFNNYGDKKMGK